jgi:16S rRNA (guanine527-N7)-methyltransferase
MFHVKHGLAGGGPYSCYGPVIVTRHHGQVSKESELLEDEPEYAAQLFGSHIERARQFTNDLARDGETLGLIGPLELPRLWTRHIVNCVLMAPLLKPGRVGDIGSGAGLPGLVLAIARPDVHFYLIEPMERRVDWLKSEASALGLHNVEVIRARAEEATFSPWLDQITARAVSSLSKLIPIAAPLVRAGGEFLFLKGASVSTELDAATKVIRRARLTNVEVLVLGEDVGADITRVFRATVD